MTVFCSHNLYKTYILNDSTFYYLALFLLAMALYFNILIILITFVSEWTKQMVKLIITRALSRHSSFYAYEECISNRNYGFQSNKLGILIHKSTTKTQNKFVLQRV